MRKISLSLLLLFTTAYSAIAQIKPVATIEVVLKGVDEALADILLPVQYSVFWGASRVDTIKGKKPLKISLNEGQTGFVDITVVEREIKLFVQKGNNIRITIDEENEEQPVNIDGPNKDGQMLLTSGQLLYPGSLLPRYKRDSTATMLEKHVQDDKAVRINIFKNLFDERKIDKPFFDFIKITLDYYHASIITEVIAAKFETSVLPKDNPFYKAGFPHDFGVLWEATYKQYPVNNPLAIRSFGFSDRFNTYASDYLNSYLTWQRQKIGAAPISADPEKNIRETINRIRNNLKPPVAEFIEADLLFSELSLEKNFVMLSALFSDYKKKYPASAYTPYIQPLADKAIAYYEKVKQDFSPEQKIIKDYRLINSFRELMANFRGKPVYIEFWATWCITCKDQFEYETPLTNYLRKNNIAHLFISVDNDKHEAEWKELIKYYNLEGYHIKANPSMLKDLSKIFWQGKGYALPLYVIVNASGNIVEFDALKPRDKKKLYQQLSNRL
ncbi:MAG: TlpA family protein disulfide reductase [Bacteroidetes bacterium]|nr:TlpA family protein disulfide reductase [Bacteroidota bacterium]